MLTTSRTPGFRLRHLQHAKRLSTAALGVLIALSLFPLSALGQKRRTPEHWVDTWSASQVPGDLGMFGTIHFRNEGFNHQTVRMVVRTTIGGNRLRVRLSNVYGSTPLLIGDAHIAVCKNGSAIVRATDRVITFGGKPSISIPAGAVVLSDAISMEVPELGELTVSVYVPENTGPTTWHPWGHHLSYVSAAGDFASAAELPQAATVRSWFWLSGVSVLASEEIGAVVVVGDSMTEGDEGIGISPGPYSSWLDVIAERLVTSSAERPELAVLNGGIAGNRLLREFVGPNGLGRLGRDALLLGGVKAVVVQEGINDLGIPVVPMFSAHAGEVVAADEFIVGLTQVAEQAHARGIRAFVCTLIPMGGSAYDSAENEAKRTAINDWIRTNRVFDGVFDFDAIIRDPESPGRILQSMDAGDHLHPNDLGYKTMGESIDLTVLWKPSKEVR